MMIPNAFPDSQLTQPTGRPAYADNDHEPLAPQTCPTCGLELRYFAIVPSAILDWLVLLDNDISTLHSHVRGLRSAVESAVLP